MGITFPQYISSKERTVSIIGYVNSQEELDKDDFTDSKGYIDENGQVWIYNCKGKPKNANEYPFFWINDEKKAEFSKPTEIMLKSFNVDRLVDMSLVNIVNLTKPNEKLFNEEEINDVISSASFYIPDIKSDDDYLKKLIKYTIIKKKIDVNRLKSKTGEKYMLPNMKAALNSTTKTSVIYFALWMELLGCDFTITITDDGTDPADPLKTPIVFESHTNKISDLVGDELIESTVANNDANNED